jgi:hypothetical protein
MFPRYEIGDIVEKRFKHVTLKTRYYLILEVLDNEDEYYILDLCGHGQMVNVALYEETALYTTKLVA